MKKVFFFLFIALIAIVLFLVKVRLKKREKATFDYRKIRIELINCSGRFAIGKGVMESLRRKGFNVYGPSFDTVKVSKTLIVDRKDEKGLWAELVAKRLAVERKGGIFRRKVLIRPEVKAKINPDPFVDCSIILGEDYKIFFPEVELNREGER